MRLINAEERECWACTHHSTGVCDTFCDCGESFELRDDVRRAKTVTETDFIQHGKWLINPDGYYPYCSECKEQPESGKMTKYCSNCGAKKWMGIKYGNQFGSLKIYLVSNYFGIRK